MQAGLWELIGLVGLVGVVVLLLLVRRNKRRSIKARPQSDFLARRANQLDWRYDGRAQGDIRYRFLGKTSQGLPWELRYDNGKSSSASVPKVYWEMTQLKANRKVFEISRGKSFEAQKNPQGQGFAAGAALMVGASSPDELDFIREASVLPVGSRRLRERFKVIARSEADVAMLVTAEIENLLLNWPSATQAGFDPYRATKIICDSQSLRVELKYDTSDMPLFEHLVKLGVALADRVSGLGTIEAR